MVKSNAVVKQFFILLEKQSIDIALLPAAQQTFLHPVYMSQ